MVKCGCTEEGGGEQEGGASEPRVSSLDGVRKGHFKGGPVVLELLRQETLWPRRAQVSLAMGPRDQAP